MKYMQDIQNKVREFIKKNKIKLISGVLLIIALMLLTIGIQSIASIIYLIRSMIHGTLIALFAVDPLLADLLIGSVCLFATALIFIIIIRRDR